MDNEYLELMDKLNSDDVNIRLESLKKLKDKVKRGEVKRPAKGKDVNNHIHTFYSFSPYSPSKAMWMAYNAGLEAAGIIDHDTISGAIEFIEAGRILGVGTTVGLECRADFSKTPLNGRSLNNPDQKSIAYIVIHGVPHNKIDELNQYFASCREKRNDRNSIMVERINDIMRPHGISLDFNDDVIPLSKWNEGGSITERHILYGLSIKLVEKFGKGSQLVLFLKESMNINLNSSMEGYLYDTENEFYLYDLLGILKSEMVPMFYVDANEECPDAEEIVKFARKIGAIPSYAYLGDVTHSVTGDKRDQKFEDDYLELLFDVIKEIGFNAVTYMPSRNSIEQLERVKHLCESYGFLQISGEDINGPRQQFLCTAIRNREFVSLYDSTWALIGHEIEATHDINKGMFSKKVCDEYPDLCERINVFKKIGILKGSS